MMISKTDLETLLRLSNSGGQVLIFEKSYVSEKCSCLQTEI